MQICRLRSTVSGAAEGAVLAIGLAEGFPGHGSRAPGECGWGMSRVGGHAARRVKEDER